LIDQSGKRCSLADELRELRGGEDGQAVAVDASLTQVRAYVAIRDKRGQIRPFYLWFSASEEFGGSDPDGPVLGAQGHHGR
jgi:hypothetical protein